MSKLFLTIFNCFLLYVGWYGAVILAAYHYPLLAPSILLPIILWEIGVGESPAKRALLVVAMIILGFFIETTMMATDLVSYASPLSIVRGGAPLWILGLWGVFGATLDDVLDWFKGKNLLILAIVGFFGASFSYFAGSLIGAISFPHTEWVALPVIGCIWALLLPLFSKARRII